MTLRHVLQNKQLVTCTTRKANNTSAYYGWFTIWESKEAFDKGICNNCIEYKHVYLGNDKSNLHNEAMQFIKNNESGFNQILNHLKQEIKSNDN